MEPNTNTPKAQPNDDIQDLHNEGIDIVGTSMALDNEYSKPEEADMPKSSEALEENTPETPPGVDTPKDIDTEPVPVAMPAPKMPSRPPEINQALEPKKSFIEDPLIKPIRTFKSDAEEAVRLNNISKADIVIAEQKKKGFSEPDTPTHASPLMYIGIVVGISILLSGGWYYWYTSSKTPNEQKEKSPVTVTPLVTYGNAVALVISPETDPIPALAAKIMGMGTSTNDVIAFAPLATTTASTVMPIGDLLAQTHIPNRLLRSLGNEYMVGTYKGAPFLILKNTFFQNAFSGMLEWEKNLGLDLLPLIRVAHPSENTQSVSAGFQDTVISNIDGRVLKNSAGDTTLVYVFADKNTILVATHQDALAYLLTVSLEVRTIQ